jgi:hypothetical protein
MKTMPSIKDIIVETIQEIVSLSVANELPCCDDFEMEMAQNESYEMIRQSIWRDTKTPYTYFICLRCSDYCDSSSDKIEDWAWKAPGILCHKLSFCDIDPGRNFKTNYKLIANDEFALFALIPQPTY